MNNRRRQGRWVPLSVLSNFNFPNYWTNKMLTMGLFFAILTVPSCRKYSEFWAIAGSQPQGRTWSPMKRTYRRPLSKPGFEMTEALDSVEVYQLRVWIREISPLIWRRLLVRSDSTIADLHYGVTTTILALKQAIMVKNQQAKRAPAHGC